MKILRFMVAMSLLWCNLLVASVLIAACYAMATVFRIFGVRLAGGRQWFLSAVETTLWWHARHIGLILRHVSGVRFRHTVDVVWPQHHSYLMVLNHQSQVDILVSMAFFYDRTPALKFFLKESLFYFPVLGQIAYLLNCPFVKRMTLQQIRANPSAVQKQREKIKQQCKELVQTPVTLAIFSEGTRFSVEKNAKQTDKTLKYLLSPQPAGLALALESCVPQVSQLIDVTLVYHVREVTTWRLLSGQMGQITVGVESYDLSAHQLIGDYVHDKKFRKNFSAWLKSLWQKKDQWIHQVLQCQGCD